MSSEYRFDTLKDQHVDGTIMRQSIAPNISPNIPPAPLAPPPRRRSTSTNSAKRIPDSSKMNSRKFLRALLCFTGLLLLSLSAATAQECAVTDQKECAAESSSDAETSAETSAESPIDPSCPDRDHLMRCAGEYLDTNKNGMLDRDELQGKRVVYCRKQILVSLYGTVSDISSNSRCH